MVHDECFRSAQPNFKAISCLGGEETPFGWTITADSTAFTVVLVRNAIVSAYKPKSEQQKEQPLCYSAVQFDTTSQV